MGGYILYDEFSKWAIGESLKNINTNFDEFKELEDSGIINEDEEEYEEYSDIISEALSEENNE